MKLTAQELNALDNLLFDEIKPESFVKQLVFNWHKREGKNALSSMDLSNAKVLEKKLFLNVILKNEDDFSGVLGNSQIWDNILCSTNFFRLIADTIIDKSKDGDKGFGEFLTDCSSEIYKALLNYYEDKMIDLIEKENESYLSEYQYELNPIQLHKFKQQQELNDF